MTTLLWGVVVLGGMFGTGSPRGVLDDWRQAAFAIDDEDDWLNEPAEPPALSEPASPDGGSAGDWRDACVLEGGKTVTFDRTSVRVMGRRRLFRWALTDGATPPGSVFTALADCGDKSIEPTWPGPRIATGIRSGGRLLIQAVCAVPGRAPSPGRARPQPADRSRRGPEASRQATPFP